uniref:Uncharacterized protein n=1 Tax=Acrobeloides nanus TaxID=290746 RepID=A0A914DZE9_9BILA
MVAKNGKCICNDGHKQAPDGKCIEPMKSCPWGERIQCYKGTGQSDSSDCIPICECIEGFQIHGKCDPNNILISPHVYKGMYLQDAENRCIVRGQNSSFELKSVNKQYNEKPRCECTNGFELQMMGHSVSCGCFAPKIKLRGKCECPNGRHFKNGSCTQEQTILNRITPNNRHQTQRPSPTRENNYRSIYG